MGEHDVRPKPQIGSAGGHGLACGHCKVENIKAMMDKDFNIELVQQPSHSHMWNVLDLTIWQVVQLGVDKYKSPW